MNCRNATRLLISTVIGQKIWKTNRKTQGWEKNKEIIITREVNGTFHIKDLL